MRVPCFCAPFFPVMRLVAHTNAEMKRISAVPILFVASLALAASFSTPVPTVHQSRAFQPLLRPRTCAILAMVGDSNEPKKEMNRPLGDNIVTQAIYSLEMMRVKSQSETPSEENGNWDGEPKEWAEEDSLAQKVSRISQVGPFAAFKQWVADSIAGDYDVEKVTARVDDTIEGSPVVMFSFTTCPFCLKAKDLFANELGIKAENIMIVECDADPEGNAIRAVLGKKTGRTSMPSVWIKGAGYVGGCNDGGLGGVVPLTQQGKLKGMLQAAGALD